MQGRSEAAEQAQVEVILDSDPALPGSTESLRSREGMRMVDLTRNRALALELREALAEIRRQAISPEDRVRKVDELFELNRDVLFQEVEPRSQESMAESREASVAAAKAAADKLAAARDGSPAAERAVLRADLRAALLEARAKAGTPEERVAAVDALLQNNADVIAEALRPTPRSADAVENTAAEHVRVPPTAPEPATPASQLREAYRNAIRSAATPEARVAATEQFLVENREAMEKLRNTRSVRQQSVQVQPTQ